MPIKVSFPLKGRLGNMLFQIAALETYCRKHGFESVYVRSEHSVRYEQNIFSSIKFSDNYPLNCATVKHDYFEYSEIPYVRCNAIIDGQSYYQSEKYFDSNVARELFSINEGTKQKILSLYPEISSYVSLHVRRGDYVNLPNFHPLCSLYYYEQAMKLFPNKTFLVFSDDIPWCKQNLKGENFIFMGNDLEDYEELYAMSLCSDNIIANSTFSWWSAYLNENLQKKVIAPDKWFGNGPSVKDMIPNHWVKLRC
jgi:hypothetical protein